MWDSSFVRCPSGRDIVLLAQCTELRTVHSARCVYIYLVRIVQCQALGRLTLQDSWVASLMSYAWLKLSLRLPDDCVTILCLVVMYWLLEFKTDDKSPTSARWTHATIQTLNPKLKMHYKTDQAADD